MQTSERLHAELGGQMLENKEAAQRLSGQMLHVDGISQIRGRMAGAVQIF
jgi:hypothetical protein